MLVIKQLLAPSNIHSWRKILWKSMGAINWVNYSFKFVHGREVFSKCVCAILKSVHDWEWCVVCVTEWNPQWWVCVLIAGKGCLGPIFFPHCFPWLSRTGRNVPGTWKWGSRCVQCHGCFLPPSDCWSCCWSTVWWEIRSVKHTPTHTSRTCVGVLIFKLKFPTNKGTKLNCTVAGCLSHASGPTI